MDSAGWSRLIKQIPTDLQELLTLMTQGGTEITVQSVARVEDYYVLVRGRLAGTNDQDRVFLVPYDRIVYAGFQRPLSPATIGRIYGETILPMTAPRPEPIAEPPAPEPEPPPPAPEPAKAPTRPRVDRAQLLERLRARTGSGTSE
jgi:hypothetical protein